LSLDSSPDLAFAPLEPAPRPDNALSPSHELDDNPRFLCLKQFHSRFLPDHRDIEVYLPEAYISEPTRRFPVFYLHDGQNLFDGRTSYLPEHTWQAHTTADRLTREGRIEPLILVGINNTGLRRVAEYTPTRDPRLRGGDGDRYGRLLVEELKPLIDRTFRTLPGTAHTGLGGSSLGGLISLYLGFSYPEVFGKLAVLSPSLWWDNRSILRTVSEGRVRPELRLWLDMGTAEGLRHLRDTDLLHRRLLDRGWRDGVDLQYLRVPNGLHNEDAWAARFDQVLRFLFPAR
jgi:predicted alpha/beta superfamily hydrolase